MTHESLDSWLKNNHRRVSKARALLEPALPDTEAGTRWADLGCGDGVFTYLLYENNPRRHIFAVDKDAHALNTLQRTFQAIIPQADIHPHQADFGQTLDLPPLDGIVMANSLHFVRRKQAVLHRVLSHLKPGGRLVLIEYNASRGNWAVPHPLDAHGFIQLAETVGLHNVAIVSRQPSRFLREMYTGLGYKRANTADRTRA